MRFKHILWAALLAVVQFWIFPDSGLAATPTLVTSGAHSVPIFHWGWVAAGLGALAFGTLDIGTLETELKEIKSQIVGKIEALKTAHGAEAAELKKQIADVQKQADAIDAKLADRIGGGGGDSETVRTILEKNDGVERLLHDRKGVAVITFPSAMLERKATIDSATLGVSTAGVLQIQRIEGITPEARPQLRLRNLLSSRPTSLQLIDFLRVTSPVNIASPQIETHDKLEGEITFEAASERVRTFAITLPAAKQAIEDLNELGAFIESSLAYAVAIAEERQMLNGSGSGEDLTGLVTAAADFDTALLPLSGWTKYDQIGRSIQQITAANEVAPTFIVLHPNDLWDIFMTKDNEGRFLLPTGISTLWGLTPLPTTNIAAGTFLVGSGNPAAVELRDRMETVVEISTQHSDFFTRNMVMFRCEKRLAQIVKRPSSFVSGSFTTSP